MIVKTIKIRNKCIEIHTHDYIMYNGACYLFCSGDKRTLRVEGFRSYTHIKCTKKMMIEIDLTTLRKVVTGNKEDRTYLEYYFF